MRRSVMKAIAIVVGILLATSGLVGGSMATATAASPGTLAATLPEAKKSSLAISALPYESITTVVAQFKGGDVRKGRVVSLQRLDGSVWKAVKDAKMDSKGKVTFKLTDTASAKYQTFTYRAVADKITYKVKKKNKTLAIVTTRNAKAQQWTRSFYDGFSDSKLDATKWTTRADNLYHDFGGSRLCSAPKPGNVKIVNGKLQLTMSKLSASSAEAVAQQKAVAQAKRDAAITSANKAVDAAKKAVDAANKKKGSAKKKALKSANAKLKSANKKLATAKKMSTTKGCPQGVFSNAMVGTDGKFTVKSGIIAARIKFPIGQGMHGSAWLQSNSRQEIDVIESYGYGKGITNVIHAKSGSKLTKYPTKAADAYVLKSDVKKSSWWTKNGGYHVFSAEFDTKQVVFRIDGKVTRTIKKTTAAEDYFLVLSLLSSDWELPLLTKPGKGAKGVKKTKLPSTMDIDWIGIWERA